MEIPLLEERFPGLVSGRKGAFRTGIRRKAATVSRANGKKNCFASPIHKEGYKERTRAFMEVFR